MSNYNWVQQFLKKWAQSAVLELHDNDHDSEHERHRVCQHHWPVPQHHAECEPERDTDRERDVHPERNALRLPCMNDLVRLRNKVCRGEQRSNATSVFRVSGTRNARTSRCHK